jgi:flagellar assembly protein FliH
MPVVKNQQAAPMIKEAIVLDLGDIGRQAARMRLAAEAKASQVVEEAQREAQQLVSQAAERGYQEGHAKGHAKGIEEGRKKGHAEALAAGADRLAKLQQAWSDVASQWESQRKDMAREANQAVLHFALAVAERVVHRVLEVDRSVIVDQVANALSHVLRPMDPCVKINPTDRPLVEEAMPQLIREFTQFEHVQLIDDESVSPGGCVVATGQGLIDAQIETQLERIVEMMLPGGAKSQPQAQADVGDAIPEGMEFLDEPDVSEGGQTP